MNFGVRIGALFYVSAFMYSTWLTRMPDVLAHLQIDKATMGLALLGGPVGALAIGPFAGRLIGRFSAGWAGVIGVCGASLMLIGIGNVSHWLALALVLFGMGLFAGLFEIGANSGAERLEVATGKKFLSQCHGFWSLGNMSGALVAGVFAQAGVNIGVHFSLVGLVLAAAALAIRNLLPDPMFVRPDAAAAAEEKPEGKRRNLLPSLAIVGICCMAFGVTVAEGAVYDWSTLYIRADIGGSPFGASVAYAIFGVCMAVGRLGGDAIRARFSAVSIVVVCSVMTGLGLVGFVFAPNVILAASALALMGGGVSLVMPISIMAAGAKPGDPAQNVALMSMLMTFAFMFAPPVFGFVAQHFGLETAFLMLLPMVALTLVCAPSARTPTAAKAGPLTETPHAHTPASL
ncbi:MFS transporter [Oryzibacter oryziterrae]|uniref:MFS transporter n=1 Tax=Oryzibacter oryziterrae TaxID=2766474 RepID=UPI001F175825|nr:MFS transporter [Oryzibacter oryziterrae]